MTISKKPSSNQSSYAFFLDKAHFYPGSNFRMSDEILEQYIKQLIGMDLDSPVSPIITNGHLSNSTARLKKSTSSTSRSKPKVFSRFLRKLPGPIRHHPSEGLTKRSSSGKEKENSYGTA